MKEATWWKILITLFCVALLVMASEECSSKSIYKLYEKVEPIELVDGAYIYVVTDGLQLYWQLPLGAEPELIEVSTDPESLADSLHNMARQYNYWHTMFYDCAESTKRAAMSATCQELGL